MGRREAVSQEDYWAAAVAYCTSRHAYYPQNFYGHPDAARLARERDARALLAQGWFRVTVEAAVSSAMDRVREVRRSQRLLRRAARRARWRRVFLGRDGVLVSWTEIEVMGTKSEQENES